MSTDNNQPMDGQVPYGYPWMPYYGPQPQGYPPPAHMMPPPGYMHGYGMQPPFPPEGHQPPPPPPEPSPEQQQLQAALHEMADQNGLGMLKGLFNVNDSDFWKGALVGAAAVMLLSNDNLRSSLMGSVSKMMGAAKPEPDQPSESPSSPRTDAPQESSL